MYSFYGVRVKFLIFESLTVHEANTVLEYFTQYRWFCRLFHDLGSTWIQLKRIKIIFKDHLAQVYIRIYYVSEGNRKILFYISEGGGSNQFPSLFFIMKKGIISLTMIFIFPSPLIKSLMSYTIQKICLMRMQYCNLF